MIRRFRCVRPDRDGQTLAIVAVMLVGLLALLGFGIDLGMAYTARAEAQRVADASALAGASAFLDPVDPLDPLTEAEAISRAQSWAEKNMVRNRMVDATEPEVIVQVFPSEQKVRVRVERTGLSVWFARFLGQKELTVSAIAAAHATAAGAPPCLMPFAVPDMWDDINDDESPEPYGYNSNNRRMDFDNQLPYNGPPSGNPNEFWQYEPDAGDEYRVDEGISDYWGNPLPSELDLIVSPGNGTGWGSDWRDQSGAVDPDDDDGERVLLKPQEAGPENQLNNWWQFWKPEGASSSYADIRDMITSGECYDLEGVTGIGGNIEPVTGDRAVVYSDIVDFIDAHRPDIIWDETDGRLETKSGSVVDEDEARGSGRVVSVPLVHPEVLARGTSDSGPLVILEVVDLFIEDPREVYGGKPNVDNSVAITGRIVRFGTGTTGVNTSKFQKVLQLIE